MPFDYNYSIFGLRPHDHHSGPDAYALWEGVRLCAFYIEQINTFVHYACCKSISIEAIMDKKVGKLEKKIAQKHCYLKNEM